MDIWTVVAKALVSLVAIVTVVGGAIADLVIPATARQHTRNPRWPPHAKFHNGQTIWLGVFSGLLAICLLWFPERDWVFQFHLAVIVVALYWLSMLGASLLPGTRWVDPEFASQTRAILGMPPQLFLMNVLLLCLIGSRDHTHVLNWGESAASMEGMRRGRSSLCDRQPPGRDRDYLDDSGAHWPLRRERSMPRSQVTIQIAPEAKPSTPSWMGEVAVFAQVLIHTGWLQTIQEQVRFARARFGTYDLIDFVVVLIGYAISSEPTLKAFYERLAPFAEPFMALFGRNQLPHRSTLSRFLAALDQTPVEALRTLFHKDLLARKPFPSPGGLFDRTGKRWLVVDVDGTRATARQRALPQTDALPAPHRRFDQVCAPGYQGRKRGEVVRTRTIVLQAHTHQFLGTFGGPGNGDYRGELLRAVQVISGYATMLGLPTASVLLRLDGLYGDAAPLLDVLAAGLGVIVRSRDYSLLDLEVVKQALARAPDHVSTHSESGMTRALYDCEFVPLTSAGPEVRLVVATHGATSSSPVVGVERDGMVYELFVSTLPSPAFTCSDVLDLYLHRGSFETVLADEDDEQNADRWYSHTPCGQEFAQILAQWVWNIRLELGQQISFAESNTTEFAPALEAEPASKEEVVPADTPIPSVIYGPPQWARASFTHGFPGSAFTPQADGTLRCPANHPLYPQERRSERDGSLRVLYAARIGHCCPCPLRAQCQESSTTLKPRRVSAVLWPLASSLSPIPSSPEAVPQPRPLAPVLWKDWPRCGIRRAWLKVIRSQTVRWTESPATSVPSPVISPSEAISTRAQRAHWRLSWEQRLARNARPTDAPSLVFTLHGLPTTFARSFGFDLLATA